MDGKSERAHRKIAAGAYRYRLVKGTDAGVTLAARHVYLALRAHHGLSPRKARWLVRLGLIHSKLKARVWVPYLFLFRPKKFQRLKEARKL